MPLWKSTDSAANSDIAALMQVNKSITTANQSLLYDNVKPGVFFTGKAVGQFGVDTKEITANPSGHGFHSGWVLRTEGTGLRAGRITYETLVAMGSMNSDGADDTYFPDYTLSITTQPASTNGAGNVTLSVVATSNPTGATLTYSWQRNNGGGWVTIPNTAGVWFNNTSPILTANAAVANANTIRVIVSATGANSVTSANASVTTP